MVQNNHNKSQNYKLLFFKASWKLAMRAGSMRRTGAAARPEDTPQVPGQVPRGTPAGRRRAGQTAPPATAGEGGGAGTGG